LDEAAPRTITGVEEADDVVEVHHYVAALEHGIARLGELPLSLRLVRELHGKLMSGLPGSATQTPGEFRRSQNWIGPPGSDLSNASYVPPPVDEMTALLSDWERYLHERGTVPDLVQCAIMHEHFEAIHPFLDGNGRVGRLLITLFLIERGRLAQPTLYLSDFIERHRSSYYDLLRRVRTEGDWISWIRYFLRGVETIAKDAAVRAQRLLGLREGLLRATGGAPELADRLLANPYITITDAAKVLEVTAPTAGRVVGNLVDRGILRETTGRNWGRIYVASEVLGALEQRRGGG
jgi:Fic family protein